MLVEIFYLARHRLPLRSVNTTAAKNAASLGGGLKVAVHTEPSEDDLMDVDDRVSRSSQAGTSGRDALQSSGSTAHAANGTSSRGVGAGANGIRRAHQPVHQQSLPMLASACPGWVCYAEKTHGDYVLPHTSSTKSPQASPQLYKFPANTPSIDFLFVLTNLDHYQS